MLEWQVDPSSEWQTPQLTGAEQLVLVCDHGYSSSLAGVSLLQLGVDTGDVIEGFEA
jgi:rhodanese-related sulfurtransferase